MLMAFRPPTSSTRSTTTSACRPAAMRPQDAQTPHGGAGPWQFTASAKSSASVPFPTWAGPTNRYA